MTRYKSKYLCYSGSNKGLSQQKMKLGDYNEKR